MSSRKRLGKNHASNWKTRWFAINRKSDPVAYAWQSPKRGWRQIWLRAWRTDWACAIFDKITAVYGQIDENESSVRKWLARKMPFTDKMVKNSRLSVKIQTFRTLFYGQMLQKAGFVRKFEWNLGWISWAALHLKKPDEVSRKSTSFVRHFV